MIIIPQLITRTREITRAIVRVEGTQTADLKINIETDLGRAATNPQNGTYSRLTITAQDYFEQLEQHTNKETVEFVNQLINDCEALGLVIEWNSGSFTFRLPDPNGSGIRIAIFSIDRRGGVAMGRSGGQFDKLSLPHEIGYKFTVDTGALLPGITQHATRKHRWSKDSTLMDLKPVYPLFMSRIKRYIDELREELSKVPGSKANEATDEENMDFK